MGRYYFQEYCPVMEDWIALDTRRLEGSRRNTGIRCADPSWGFICTIQSWRKYVILVCAGCLLEAAVVVIWVPHDLLLVLALAPI